MNSNVAGKYIHESNRSNYLELKPDGTCFLFEGSSGVSGTYELDGSLITIFNAGSYTKGLIQDGVITDAEGDKWIRATAVAPSVSAPATAPRQATPGPATFDQRIDSIPWLRGLIAQNLPWELFEAIGWVAVLIVVLISLLNSKA